MVKTPKTRHSKTKREPVTIDLDPASVSRDSETSKGAEGAGMTGQAQTETTGADTAEPTGKNASGAQKAASGESGEPAPSQEKGRRKTGRAKDAPGTTSGKAAGGDAGVPPQGGTGGDGSSGAREPSLGRKHGRAAGAGMAVGAGLVGGVIALLLAGGLQWGGVLPAPGPDRAGARQAVSALRQDIGSLQGKVAQLQDVSERPAGPGKEVAQRLDNLENDVAGLKDSVSKLQSAAASGEAGSSAALDALQTRLSRLESRVSKLAQADGQAAAGEEMASRLADLAGQVDAAGKAAATASSAADQNARQLNDLQDRIAELGRRVESGGESSRFAPVVAAMALDAAVRRGAPFESELESYAAVAKDSPAVEELRPYAGSGLPGRAEIAFQASDAADRMIRAARGTEETGGVLDRLLASARSLVVVRPVGEATGDTVPAIAARIESAVRQGDYEAALKEYASLPQEAKAATADFADRLRALQTADRIVEQALSEALKSA